MTKPISELKIAAVVPRYDNGLGGGAETLVKSLVDNLHRSYPSMTLEVWTTCARDHRTWENYYNSGNEILDGVNVKRFHVDERNLGVFINCEVKLQQGQQLPIQEQLEWLENGVNSRDLYHHISSHGSDFDLILFAPYLFPTSFWGALIYPERSVLIPCLHYERYAFLDVIKHQFYSVKGLMFNAQGEKDLAESLYGSDLLSSKGFVVGMSFDEIFNTRSGLSAIELFQKYPSLKKDYIIYSGRKETGKNLDLLIEYFCDYQRNAPDCPLQLVLIGAGQIDFLKVLPENVIDLGFVSEQDKTALLENARALCQPSVNESFSIVIMEAWLSGTPVIVHKDCGVTKNHVEESNGGYVFSDSREFSITLKQILEDKSSSEAKGESGRIYVKREYCWDSVYRRFYDGLVKLGIAQ